MKHSHVLWSLGIAALLLSPGCSLQKIALDQTAGILKNAMPAFEQDDDYELVEAGLPGSIKMVEGFLQTGPKNRDLLLMAAQANTSYAMVFLEDLWERAEEDSDAAERALARATKIYLRGHGFGLRLLEQNHPGVREALSKGEAEVKAAIAGCTTADVPALFWTSMPLAAAVNLAREDVEMIAMLGKAKAMVARVLELNPGYYHAASHMIFGALYGGVGPSLGGDAVKAKMHFDAALKHNNRKFLLIQVMMAQTLAVQTQDRKLFDALIEEVLSAELSIYPEQKLANVAAKRKAERLKAKADDLF